MWTKPKFISSITDWFLIITSFILLSLELLAVAGFVPFITNEMVEMSVYQLWIPAVCGALFGHFYPLPWRYPSIKIFLAVMFSGVGGYVIWYLATPAEELLQTLDILSEYLYAFFLSGYLLGSTFFSRPAHPLEG
jgi:hypothetical protein